jgi:hypothetical protein
MSVAGDDETIALEGHCGIEDVEPLLSILQRQPGHLVDLSRATHLHGAVLQLLLVFRPRLSNNEGDPFIAKWLMPLLKRRHGSV